jgi:hypothetical protein
MQLSICEFCDDWRRGGHTFLTGMNEILFAHVPWSLCNLESNERHGRPFVLRHAVWSLVAGNRSHSCRPTQIIFLQFIEFYSQNLILELVFSYPILPILCVMY